MLKRLAILATLAVAMISGCATPIASSKPAVATHKDLLAAAKLDTDAGYPARAAYWLALDTRLTACEAAIDAFKPVKTPLPSDALFFTTFEAGALAVGSITSTPPSVTLNCEPLPVPAFPIFKLP
jgi:hypothetical protein